MKKFLKKNNKKVMAFFGVFLMIAFAAQSRYGSGAGGPGAGVIGHIGDDKITEADLQSARQERNRNYLADRRGERGRRGLLKRTFRR